MSGQKDENAMELGGVALPVNKTTAAGGIKLVAGLLPTAPGTMLAGVAELMDADVKRAEVLNTFKQQVAGMLNVKPSQVNEELIEKERGKLPEWFTKEWDDANDITGKTSNFFVSALVAVGCGVAGNFLVPIPPLLGAGVGLVAGYFVTDMVVKEYRNARGDVGGVSTTSLAKSLKAMAQEHQVDPTLVATMMLISKQPESNTEELEEMVQKHLEQKQENPKGVTDLEGFISMNEGYLVSLLGEDVQSKFPRGTRVQDIVAQHLISPAHVDALMWKPEAFYDSVSQNVHDNHLQRLREQRDLAQHGKAILQTNGQVHQRPPSVPAHEHGRGAG